MFEEFKFEVDAKELEELLNDAKIDKSSFFGTSNCCR